MKAPQFKSISSKIVPDRVEESHEVNQATWEEFKQGDEDAFVQIYQQYFVSLYRYGTQFTFSKDLIQNTIQDLFIDLRKKRDKLSISRIRPYLFVSFRRRLIANLNSKKEAVVYNSDLLEGYHFQIEVSAEQKIIDDQQEIIDQKRLKEAVDSLPVKQKEAIYLYYFENLSYEEVMQLMSIRNINAVRNLVYKAVKHLRSGLISWILIGLNSMI